MSFLSRLLHCLNPPGKIPFNPSGPTITIPVELTHQGSTAQITMALDTGASITVLDTGIATALNLKPEKSTPVATAAGIKTASQATLDSLTALGQTQTKAPILITSLASDPTIDGLLGLSFLKHHRLIIDPHQKTINLS